MLHINQINIVRKSGIREELRDPRLLIESKLTNVNLDSIYLTPIERAYYKRNLINLEPNPTAIGDGFIANQNNWIESDNESKIIVDTSEINCRLKFQGTARNELIKFSKFNPGLILLTTLDTTWNIKLRIYFLSEAKVPHEAINLDLKYNILDLDIAKRHKSNLELFILKLDWNQIYVTFFAELPNLPNTQSKLDFFQINQLIC